MTGQRYGGGKEVIQFMDSCVAEKPMIYADQ